MEPSKPDQWSSKQEEYDGLSEEPGHHSLRQRPALILLLGEEDRLREIDPVQVSKVFVVMVMAISPSLEGEMNIDSDKTPCQLVEQDALEEREVCHVVELDEKADNIESVESPAQVVIIIEDKDDGENFVDNGHGESSPGKVILGLTVLDYVFLHNRNLLIFGAFTVIRVSHDVDYVIPMKY